jgi:hypothetical protein
MQCVRWCVHVVHRLVMYAQACTCTYAMQLLSSAVAQYQQPASVYDANRQLASTQCNLLTPSLQCQTLLGLTSSCCVIDNHVICVCVCRQQEQHKLKQREQSGLEEQGFG